MRLLTVMTTFPSKFGRDGAKSIAGGRGKGPAISGEDGGCAWGKSGGREEVGLLESVLEAS